MHFSVVHRGMRCSRRGGRTPEHRRGSRSSLSVDVVARARSVDAGAGGAPPSLRGAQANPDPCSAFARRSPGALVACVARWRQCTCSISVGLDHPEAAGNGSGICRRGRPAHDRRVVACIVQGREVPALPEATDWTRLHPWPDAETGSRLRTEGRYADLRNVEGHASFGRCWRAEDQAAGQTAVASIRQRSTRLTRSRRYFETPITVR